MVFLKRILIFLTALCLFACSSQPQLQPLRSVDNLTLEISATADAPEVSARFEQQNNIVFVLGEVRKRDVSSLNGDVHIAVVDPSGAEIWHENAELEIAGSRHFHFRTFKKQLPFFPEPHSKIIVEFHHA
ncbi:MAG: hypothetical protein JWM78_3719 [Verrucomicrobiaceae bacterium]|nr:hypothetical protein [Verrucomicrobiaceae bacterium]